MKLAVWASAHTQAVLKHGSVLLSGAPGSGKSQLIRTMLIPALISSGARVLVIDAGDALGTTPDSRTKSPLRRLVLGSADAPMPTSGMLESSCLVTFDCPQPQRLARCERLLQSLHGELGKHPLPDGKKRVLVLDIPQAAGATPSFDLMIRSAGRLGLSVVATSQSPSSLDEATLAAFECHIGFYHFFKRCLKRMAQELLYVSGEAAGDETGKPVPLNPFWQPIATPVSRLAGELAQLKVGECILGVPGQKLEKLKARG